MNTEIQKGEELAQGKTKIIYGVQDRPEMVIVKNKSALTKFDDPSQTQQMAGKEVHATATTCRVFELLRESGIPVAYQGQISPTEFAAQRCQMIPLEVVARRFAVGSCLNRSPQLRHEDGQPPHRFHRLVVEFFLKTTDGKIKNRHGQIGETPYYPGTKKPIDDPLISNPGDKIWQLRHPKVPLWDMHSELSAIFGHQLTVCADAILPDGVSVRLLEAITREVFLVLEGAWAVLGYRLIDFKIEFGVSADGELLVADVIDNDSWRLRDREWQELSKQLFRDDAGMEQIANAYALVAKLVEQFRIPRQALVLWRGSEKDQFPELSELPVGVQVVKITRSGHKSPNDCMQELKKVLTDFPEGGVILALVGMSNGLGPMLASRTSWPVFAVPLTAKEKPHDVWSSLETPSEVPLATTLSFKNATLAALNILAQKNPAAYARRQSCIEELDGNL
ncbi:MAG: phosphoribosylaminoimidazolesuccinocarboxamide synthase [bacterium]|nr:phosphoribosylaminoimidazolesuccinocarboxamide synthase [bacterium]